LNHLDIRLPKSKSMKEPKSKVSLWSHLAITEMVINKRLSSTRNILHEEDEPPQTLKFDNCDPYSLGDLLNWTDTFTTLIALMGFNLLVILRMI